MKTYQKVYTTKYVIGDEYHRNSGRVVLFGTTESLTNLAKGRGILVDGTFKGKILYYNIINNKKKYFFPEKYFL